MAGPECIVCDGMEGPGLRYCSTCENLICSKCRPRFEESPSPDTRSNGSEDDSGAESWYEPPEIPATWCYECEKPLLHEPLPPSTAPPAQPAAPAPALLPRAAALLAPTAPVIDLRTPELPAPVIDLRTPEPAIPAIDLVTPEASPPPPLRLEAPEFASFPWRGRHKTGVRVGIGNPEAGAEFVGVVVYMVDRSRDVRERSGDFHTL